MKNFIYILFAVFLSTGAMAQDKTTKASSKSAKAATDGTAPTQQEKATRVKKDGTPDMRYSENKKKNEIKPAGPLKKDGTPDMRHKANKDAAAPQQATPVRK